MFTLCCPKKSLGVISESSRISSFKAEWFYSSNYFFIFNFVPNKCNYFKLPTSLKVSTKPQMAIITLTTDFGLKDHFTGAVKGAILSELADARIIDISHSVSPFTLLRPLTLFRTLIKVFPKERFISLVSILKGTLRINTSRSNWTGIFYLCQ